MARGQPLIDGTLGVRVSVWYRRDGGWINQVDPTTGAVVDPDTNRGEVLMLRLAAVWQPGDSLQVTPSILYQSSHKHNDGYLLAGILQSRPGSVQYRDTGAPGGAG